MIAVQLKGGLGNQMFQFAAAYSLSKKFKKKLTVDLSFIETNISESDSFTPRKFGLYIFPKVNQFLINKNLGVRIKEINNSNHSSNFIFERLFGYQFILKDYFQSESFFQNYRDEVIELFNFDIKNLSEETLTILSLINSHNLISIHMRKGDYLKPKVNEFHGVVGIDFYLKAINYFKQKLYNPKFILFSDDPELAQSEFKPFLSDFFVVKNSQNKNSWIDMYLMSQCYGNIIANSSFSWWGAYLNKNNNNTVIAPKKWFLKPELHKQYSNLIPQGWITL
jgi:hypothetical protein